MTLSTAQRPHTAAERHVRPADRTSGGSMPGQLCTRARESVMKVVACLGALSIVSAPALAGAQAPSVPAPSPQQTLVTKYCAGCHNDTKKSGGFSWTTIDLSDPARNAEASERGSRWV